jgi:hypothetical protein
VNLSHYTAEPLLAVRSMPQPGTQPGWGAQPKPHGLWLSVDGEDDWAAWCESEHFACGDKYHYRIYLARPESVLRIDTALDLRVFTERYGSDMPYPYRKGNYIDWPRVAQEHAGIVIAPYQWSCRLADDTFWYYSWDCASGCIWDADIIDRVELVGRKLITPRNYELPQEDKS